MVWYVAIWEREDGVVGILFLDIDEGFSFAFDSE